MPTMKSSHETKNVPDLAQVALLRGLASTVARQAGQLAAQMRNGTLQVAETKSTQFDVATDADLACETLLRHEILRARPDDGILGEEGDSIAGSSGLTWVIDPIDGTTNFLYGLADWAVSVAVVAGPPADPIRWRPIAGSVYMPDLDTQYDAGLGLGTQRNGLELQTPAPGTPGRASELEAALLAVGFSYDPTVRREQGLTVGYLAERARDLRNHGATAVELCNVAAGTVDGYWEERLSPWDVAAGLLIAEEAGCTVRWQERHSATGTELALIACGEESLAREVSQTVARSLAT
ncbi:inositol monophosphatase [Glutamicibacter sp. MNS18]|uniref:inositol monophosphatase family protein n=1 Tax=Glutamicibacter sp. MNS18 TaxID=2989817 RepID=UPI0022365A1C|nr:inositol monophosphatase family protein [Glutamicibacter sp. MNS18]MCW4466783.1 inositol monophosphatase [Glutamicibacter sp. MNS18]